MHAADKNMNCVQHHKTQERAAELTRDRTLTQQDKTRSASVRTLTTPKLKSAGIRTPRSNMKQGTQTIERMAQARSKPHAHVKTGHDGSVRALSQNS